MFCKANVCLGNLILTKIAIDEYDLIKCYIMEDEDKANEKNLSLEGYEFDVENRINKILEDLENGSDELKDEIRFDLTMVHFYSTEVDDYFFETMFNDIKDNEEIKALNLEDETIRDYIETAWNDFKEYFVLPYESDIQNLTIDELYALERADWDNRQYFEDRIYNSFYDYIVDGLTEYGDIIY